MIMFCFHLCFTQSPKSFRNQGLESAPHVALSSSSLLSDPALTSPLTIWFGLSIGAIKNALAIFFELSLLQI